MSPKPQIAILTVLRGGKGWFFGNGSVMSSNLPEQPISSKDMGRSVGPTGGTTVGREAYYSLKTGVNRRLCMMNRFNDQCR